MGFSMTELNKMTIRDRKAYIRKHNGEQAKKQADYKSKGNSNTNNSTLMNQVARMKQDELENMTNNRKAAI